MKNITFNTNANNQQQASVQTKETKEIQSSDSLSEITRTEFGFERTICSCESCVSHCKLLPGYLIPQDLERIARYLGNKNIVTFAIENLLASQGAIVMKDGRPFRIPTLVPKRKANGSCTFLDENNLCRIHAVSPFGCAMFEANQSSEEADMRSSRGLYEIARCWANPSTHLYTIIWRMLDGAGLRAIPAHIARQFSSSNSSSSGSR